jgi:hypothetical protein
MEALSLLVDEIATKKSGLTTCKINKYSKYYVENKFVIT